MKENVLFETRKRICPFSRNNSPKIDYKDVNYYLNILLKKVKWSLVELQMSQEEGKKNYQ